MKKTTLLIAAVIFSFAANSQSFPVNSIGSFPNYTHSSQSLLWDQTSFAPWGSYSSITNQSGNMIVSADDFELTQSSRIDKITVFGYENGDNFLDILEGLDLYIYGNSVDNSPNGNPVIPGSGLLEIVNYDPLGDALNIINTDGNFYAFELDITLANGGEELILPAGNYWVVAAPRLDIFDVGDFASWKVFTTYGSAGINQAHFIDPANLLNIGATNWTPFSVYSLPVISMGFTVEGEPLLGVGENIENLVVVFPNPTTDILNVKVPASVNVNNANLINILGANTGLRLVNGSIDTSSLSSGFYILTLNTSAGTLTQKILKQ
ncbi:hypothetical protein Aeqsu_2316 [Aequorivita sublithincola DSM 14238]|uniref:Secretion system C-terminal sorting domain-containing protein n=1 Tax=Aequorivita sublithincola (strain DSM 14238 / LMG 21431 / ACAM 643 / 9-3) TaxID=746697 RepID=I3YXQ8_AEQSU|nr:T9SS type A sorting domain-containing protein [Aequorivita sublithincola]AFL81776.1 hypothetical protein Aeqsu_2316 [Aequorivita sublithincola DSM 14238]